MITVQYLFVTEDIDGETGITSLSVKDILFLRFDRQLDRVIVHTLNNHFYVMGTLKYFSTGLNKSGYNFKIIDRNNAVNVDRIVSVDTVYKMAFFEIDVHRGSKSCTMSVKRFNLLQKEFEGNPNIIVT